MMVVNASNREKIVGWIQQNITAEDNVQLIDRTCETAMIAVQGPKANEVVAKLSDTDPNSFGYYTGGSAQVCGHEAIVTRTGYTGEDGCEIIADAKVALEITKKVHELAVEVGGGPAGLGARDTLRLEAAMPLYGQFGLLKKIPRYPYGWGWYWRGDEPLGKIVKFGGVRKRWVL